MERVTHNAAYKTVDYNTGEVFDVPSVEDKVRTLLDEGWLLLACYRPHDGEKIIACDICSIGNLGLINTEPQVWRWDEFAQKWYDREGQKDRGRDFILYKPFDGNGWDI